MNETALSSLAIPSVPSQGDDSCCSSLLATPPGSSSGESTLADELTDLCAPKLAVTSSCVDDAAHPLPPSVVPTVNDEDDGQSASLSTESASNEGTHAPLDLQAQRRLEQNQALLEASGQETEPAATGSGAEAWKNIRKGVVGAVGGTLVGVGLVLIPVPIPLGAVTVSAGLAVLGTEFDEAREMNEKLIKETKEKASKARDQMIRTIESMEDTETIEESGVNEALEFEEDSQTEEESTSNATPFMNPKERERQQQLVEKAAKEQQKLKHQAARRRTFLPQSTVSFLSQNVLPFLKRSQIKEAEERAAAESKSSEEEKEEARNADDPVLCTIPSEVSVANNTKEGEASEDDELQ